MNGEGSSCVNDVQRVVIYWHKIKPLKITINTEQKVVFNHIHKHKVTCWKVTTIKKHNFCSVRSDSCF